MSLKILQITVCEDTADSLMETADTMGLSLGEVVDRLVMLRMAKDAQSAALLISEYILLYTTHLSQEDFSETLRMVQKLITEPNDNINT